VAYRSTDNWVLSQSRYQLGMKYFGDCPFPVLRHGFSMKIVFFFFFEGGSDSEGNSFGYENSQ